MVIFSKSTTLYCRLKVIRRATIKTIDKSWGHRYTFTAKSYTRLVVFWVSTSKQIRGGNNRKTAIQPASGATDNFCRVEPFFIHIVWTCDTEHYERKVVSFDSLHFLKYYCFKLLLKVITIISFYILYVILFVKRPTNSMCAKISQTAF